MFRFAFQENPSICCIENGPKRTRESREEAAAVVWALHDGGLPCGQGAVGVQRTKRVGGLSESQTDRPCGWMGLGWQRESGAVLTDVRATVPPLVVS